MALARRFLHVALNVGNADTARAFYEQALGLRLVMRTDPVPGGAELLGFEGQVLSEALFLYDWRGPRSATAVEVVAWLDPATEGAPYPGPDRPGIHALLYEVPSVEAVLSATAPTGAAVTGRAEVSVLDELPRTTVLLRDVDGVNVEVVEARPGTPAASAPTATAAGLRLTCSDLDESVGWYRTAGFEVLAGPAPLRLPGEPYGLVGDVEVRVARLALAEDDPPYVLCLVEWPGDNAAGGVYPVANHRGLYRMALRVDDAEEATHLLREQGVVVRGPFPVDLAGTKVAGLQIAMLTDPDGIVVELVQRSASYFRATG